jgi:hypothetical protein
MLARGGGVDATATASRVERGGWRRAGIACLAAAAVAYAGFLGWLASDAQLGNDELFTLYFARLPGMGDVWRELRTGVEQTPPLFYVLTRASLRAFGDTSLALRVPELAGFALATVSALIAVARRSSALYGLLAALLLLGTQATFYAFEARPYALVLGLVAAGFLGWQLRTDGRGGSAAVVGMTAALTAAVACHYYAILAVAPIVAGEAARAWRRRRIDTAVAAGLAAAVLPLVAAAPLIDGARAYSGTFWTEVAWVDAIEFNGWLFRTSAVSGELAPRLPLALLVWLLCGLALHALLFRPRRPGRDSAVIACMFGTAVSVAAVTNGDIGAGRWLGFLLGGVTVVVAYGWAIHRRGAELAARAEVTTLQGHEIVAIAGFLAVPSMAVALAMLSTDAYTPRYALPAALGVALLLPLGLHRVQGSRLALVVVTVCALAAFAGRVAWYQHLEQDAEAAERAGIVSFLRRNATGDLPVVVAHPQRFFELSHQRPGELAGRLLHLSSSRLALRYIGTDSTEDGLQVLRRFAPLDVRNFEAFTAVGRPFFLLETPDAATWNWTTPALRDQGRVLRVVTREHGMTLFEVR